MNMYEPEIIEHLTIASDLIAEAYSKCPKSDVFDQAGLLNGKEIVLDYISHGECGVAIEHLLYMVHKSEGSYPKDKLASLHDIAKQFTVRNNYVSTKNRGFTEWSSLKRVRSRF